MKNNATCYNGAIDFQEKKQILKNLKKEEIPPSTNLEIIDELKSQINKEQMKLKKVRKSKVPILYNKYYLV